MNSLVRTGFVILLTSLVFARPISAQTGRTFTYDCVGEPKITLADTLVVLRVKRDTSRVSVTPCITRKLVDTVVVVLPPTDTATVPVPAPVPAPSGWTKFAELGPPLPLTGGFRIADNAASVTATLDPTGQLALAMRFPAGYDDGSSPASVYHETFPPTPRLRWESVVSYPTNYVKHNSSVDKIVFVRVNGENRMFTMMYDPVRLRPAIGLQMVVGGSVNLTANLASVELPRGQRGTLACEAVGNTAGQANGTVECWLDGVKFLSRSGIAFTTSAALFTGVSWTPIWGGNSGQTLAIAQSVYLNRLTVYR